MANKRMIYQDMFEDDEVGALSIAVRLLWVGIISCMADDQGRLIDNASLIKSKVFAYDMDVTNDNVADWINQLVKSRMIMRYESGNKSLLQIRSWWKYQTPSWAQESKFDAPSNWTDRIKVHTTNNKVKTINWDQPGGLCGTVPTSVPTPVPSHVPTALDTGLTDVNCDVKINIKSEVENEIIEISSGVFFEPSKIFQEITGMGAIPGTQLDKVLTALESLWYEYGKDTESLTDYLKPFYEAWITRKSKNGAFYSKANCSWLYDWAIAGEIPAEPKPAYEEKPKTRILRDAYGVPHEVPY